MDVNLKRVGRRATSFIRNRWRRILLYIALISVAGFFLLPLWGALTTSLKTTAEVRSSSPLSFPSHITFSPYINTFNELKGPIVNSVLITTGGTAGSVFLGSICGFVFSKYRFKYDTIIFILLAIGIFIPFQAILIPLYQTIKTLGLVDTIPGLILIHTAYGIPMCALLFRGFYGAIPKNIINQARVDGIGPWKIYTNIVLPSTVVATVTVVIFQFTSIWNEFLFGLVFGKSNAVPATVQLTKMVGTTGVQWNNLMAGSMIVALPILIIFIVLGRYLVRGYMSGAVTG